MRLNNVRSFCHFIMETNLRFLLHLLPVGMAVPKTYTRVLICVCIDVFLRWQTCNPVQRE
jgi:hypothetical protein